MSETTTTEQLRGQVRERYAAAAVTVASSRGTASCCDDNSGDGGPCCGQTALDVDDTFGRGDTTTGLPESCACR